jgi:hypothetical protein
MNTDNTSIKKSTKYSFVVFVLLQCCCVLVYSQTPKYTFGYFIGINAVPTSFSNFSATGREIGLSIIKTKKANQKFECQINVGFIRKKIKLVQGRYNNEYARGSAYLKPKYNVFEIASLLNYNWYEKKNGAQIKIIGGISINFNNAVNYAFGSHAWRGSLGVNDEITIEDAGGRNVSANIVIGLSTTKFRKKNGRPITWTLLYQKAVSKSPSIHIAGNVQLNSDPVIHYNYNISPYLDLLSVRLSFCPIWHKQPIEKVDVYEEDIIDTNKLKSIRTLD